MIISSDRKWTDKWGIKNAKVPADFGFMFVPEIPGGCSDTNIDSRTVCINPVETIPFSARVFDARYFIIFGASRPFSLTISRHCSFQSNSEKVLGVGESRRIAAPDDVITIRFTDWLMRCT